MIASPKSAGFAIKSTIVEVHFGPNGKTPRMVYNASIANNVVEGLDEEDRPVRYAITGPNTAKIIRK